MNLVSDRTRKAFAKEKDGSVTIEFVATMPLMLAALAFSFEFGQMFLAYQSTASNVRSAARYLARLDNPSPYEDNARDIIRTGTIGGEQPFSYLADACDGSGPTGDCITVRQNSITIDVQVDYPLQLFGFIGGESGVTLPIRVVETSRRTGS